MGKVIAALIIGVSLVAAGFAAGGRYAISSAGNRGSVYMVDRYTGLVWHCWTGDTGRCTTPDER
jgi:hypothetical protein